MDVLVKDIKMPSVGHIIIVFPSGRALEVSIDKTQNIYREAEAVELPPHGRLIDAGALMERFSYSPDDTLEDKYWIRAARRIIIEASTIIPADKEGEE